MRNLNLIKKKQPEDLDVRISACNKLIKFNTDCIIQLQTEEIQLLKTICKIHGIAV